MSDDIPAHLRKFLPGQPPEPTPAEQSDAWLAENGPGTDAERWRVRSSPSAPRTWIGFAAAFGIGLAVIAMLGWRAVG